MAVGTDTGIGIGDGRTVLIDARPHALGDVFEVHLVADASTRRDCTEILETLRAPFEEVIALCIASIFEFDVLLECLGMAEFVDHDRVIDHEVDRNLRIDLGRIAAQLGNRIAHGCKIDHARHSGKILQQHARGAVLDLAAGCRVVLPIGNRLDVSGRHGESAILEPQQVFEQDLHRNRQAGNIADCLCRLGERVIGIFLAIDVEGSAGSERVLADLGHGRV